VVVGWADIGEMGTSNSSSPLVVNSCAISEGGFRGDIALGRSSDVSWRVAVAEVAVGKGFSLCITLLCSLRELSMGGSSPASASQKSLFVLGRSLFFA